MALKPVSHEAYCMKCKEKRVINKAEILETKNGMRRLSGVCSRCLSKVSKILPKFEK